MKKTVNVNLNGRVFTVDEDACRMLENYLRNLRIYFRKEDGADEIIADFEARIEELLSEKIRLGYQVISISQVEEVIARVGKPADFLMDDSTEEDKQASSHQETKSDRKKFFRNPDDKVIGGVCSGISAYFNVDVLPIRIAFVVALFIVWFLLPAYLLCWIVLPEARTAEEKLQMRGQAVTVENIGKTVAGEKRSQNGGSTGFLSDLVRAAGGFLKICFIAVACLFCLPLIFVVIVLVIVLLSVLLGLGSGLSCMIPLELPGISECLTISHPVLAIATFIVVLLVPLIILIYGVIAYIAKWKPVHPGIKWAGFVIWLSALILFCCSGLRLGGMDVEYSIEYNAPAEKEYRLPPVEAVSLEEGLTARLEIEQIAGSGGDSISLKMSGDEDLLKKVQYRIDADKLHLFAHDYPLFSPDSRVKIYIKAPSIRAIKMKGAGTVVIGKPFIADRLTVEMKGAGKLQADSLAVDRLDVDSEGVGSIHLKGLSRAVKFDLDGTGKIDAYQLMSDTVYANVEGIGSLRIYPTEYLKARVDGIGKIIYRGDPKQKDLKVSGIGKCRKG
jgi:phage shock protein PspC (stress-responsive transcriptional regulator)